MIDWWWNDPADIDTEAVEYSRVGLLMTLLNSGYHCHGSPYIITVQPRPITGVVQWAGGCQANNPQPCWNGWGRIKNAKRATSSGDWHKASCLPAPQRFASFYCCPSFSSSLSFVPCFSPTILPFVATLHEVDITPPCCYDIDQPRPSPLFLSLSSLHSPLHWFHPPLPLSPLARSDYTRCSHTVMHTHTHTNTQIRVFGRDVWMCSLALL